MLFERSALTVEKVCLFLAFRNMGGLWKQKEILRSSSSNVVLSSCSSFYKRGSFYNRVFFLITLFFVLFHNDKYLIDFFLFKFFCIFL